MKKEQYKKQDAKELVNILGEKREALRGFRFGASGSKTKNVKSARNLRRDIARILTVLNSVTTTS